MIPSSNPVSVPNALDGVRSVLFAPAVRPDFVAKLPSRGADAVVLDCEDAVAPEAKAGARSLAHDMTDQLVDRGVTVITRVNAPATEWFVDDIEALSPRCSAVMIPKLEDVAGVAGATDILNRAGLGHLGIFAGIETALGVADSRLVMAHQQVVAAYFGAEDFIADMGGVRTDSNAEVVYARSLVALSARLGGVPVYDQVVTDFRNENRFRREAIEARNLGYAGKLCIHPGQVMLANESFTPSIGDVDRARRLLAAYDQARAQGLAAIDFEGQMVDEPLAAQARSLLARAASSHRKV